MPALLPAPTLFERRPDVNTTTTAPGYTPATDASLLSSLAFGAYKHSGLMRLHESLRRCVRPAHATVFLFHRVTDAIPHDGLTVGTAWFSDFCRLIRDHYHPLRLDQLEPILRETTAPPRRTVAITFDDCYADNLAAAEVLHEHGLSATFFVPTRYVGTNHRFWWDEQLPPMANLTWNDVRLMQRLGHSIGSHSVSHPDFGQLGEAEARTELVDSLRTLDQELGTSPRWFAFPYGGTENIRDEQPQLVIDSGYVGSFSAVSGFIEPTVVGGSLSTRALPRVPAPYFRDLTHLELHVNRCLDWLHASRRWVRGWKKS